MAEAYTVGQLEKYQAFVQKAAIAAMHEMAPSYNLDPAKLDLRWDDRMGQDMWTYKYDESVKRGEILFGMSALNKNFKYTLRHALDVISKGASQHITNLESVQTTESRNRRISDRYENAHEGKKMLRSNEYETHTFTSVMMVHKKSGQSVMVSGEGLLAHDLQTEAYMLLCKKVVGE